MKYLYISSFIILFLISGREKEKLTDDTPYKPRQTNTGTGYGNGKIVVCGSNKIYIINLKKSTTKKLDIEWEWAANKARDLPVAYSRSYFNHIDECKPSSDGNRLYVTASSGGVAVINIANKKVLFYAFVPMAHSIEELPNDKLAVISSTSHAGNAIDIFSIHQNKKSLFRDSITSGHGLAWHKSKKVLYALGGRELRAYSVEGNDTDHPSLSLLDKWFQPGTGGHDLHFIPDSTALILTDTKNVWSFNLDHKLFSAYKPLGGYKNVKSVSVNKTDGRILLMRPEEKWWAFHVRILDPYISIPIPDMNVYKTRWFYN